MLSENHRWNSPVGPPEPMRISRSTLFRVTACVRHRELPPHECPASNSRTSSNRIRKASRSSTTRRSVISVTLAASVSGISSYPSLCRDAGVTDKRCSSDAYGLSLLTNTPACVYN